MSLFLVPVQIHPNLVVLTKWQDGPTPRDRLRFRYVDDVISSQTTPEEEARYRTLVEAEAVSAPTYAEFESRAQAYGWHVLKTRGIRGVGGRGWAR